MGGVMAARLSEDSDVRVALVEADPGDNIHSPLGFAQLLRTKVDWDYSTAPEPFTDMQRIYLPRGKVLGGSSSINAMVYVRGNRADYDGWAEGGSPGWGYQDLLPYFELAEDNERGASEFHGAGAPLRVSESRSRNPISDAFLEAPKPGYPVMRTSTGKRTTASATTRSPSGMGAVAAPRWRTCTRPRRAPTSSWRPLCRSTGSFFEGQRAVGVQASRWGEIYELRAEREVVLCGGACNSPQLLMLSGVGPADDLARLGLPVVQDLPCVGHGLQDHPVVWLSWAHDEPVSLLSAGTEDDTARFTQEGRGPLCSNLGEAGGFIRTHPRLPGPDVQFHVVPRPDRRPAQRARL